MGLYGTVFRSKTEKPDVIKKKAVFFLFRGAKVVLFSELHKFSGLVLFC